MLFQVVGAYLGFPSAHAYMYYIMGLLTACKWLGLALLLLGTGVLYRVLVRGDDTCTVDGADPSCGSVLAEPTARDDHVRLEVLGRLTERVDSVDSSEVFFSVKTAGHYHASRLSILLLTWLQAVLPHQVVD